MVWGVVLVYAVGLTNFSISAFRGLIEEAKGQEASNIVDN
jgi:hypothetical protein